MCGGLGFEGGGQDIEDIAVLLAAGFDDGEQGLDEAAAGVALGAEREFAPDHGVAQDLFGAVVGRLRTGVGEEHPELVPAIEEVRAECRVPRVRGPHPVFESLPQVVLHSEPNAIRHRAARDCPTAIGVPVVEHRAQVCQQSLAYLFSVSAAIDQGLEVAFLEPIREPKCDWHWTCD